MRSVTLPCVSRIALALAFATGPSLLAAEPPGIGADDQVRIRGVLEEYRSAWLANDAAAVLRVFTTDAVLMPHHGVEPVVGKQAARAFWFPTEGPPTTVTSFTQSIDDIGGTYDLAYVRGRSKVEWTTGKGPEATRSGNAGTNLTILRRQADGSWRIAVQMWDDPPNQRR